MANANLESILAKQAQKPNRGKSAQQPRRRSINLWRALLKLIFYAGLLISIAVSGYLIHVDRTITETFEGRRWSVPAQIYAQPLELYVGSSLNRADLKDELERLGYRSQTNLIHPGTFEEHNQSLRIYLRAFRFMQKARASQRITIHFKNNQISRISGAQGNLSLVRLDPAIIGSFFPSHGEDRIILTPNQVPELLSQGLKAIEDRNFDQHAGFSLTGIARAFIVNLRAGERQQGGSTLTQQLVRSYFLNNRRTIERKLKEVAMAVILDARFSKEDLLTAYVNEIFLGQNGNRAIHGFGLGAQFYFNKPLSELEIHETATLLAIIRGPSFYNPFRHPKRTLERRNRILDILHRDQIIDDKAIYLAQKAKLNVVSNHRRGGTYYPAFTDQVRAELKLRFPVPALSSEGLRIFTTLKPHTQENVQTAVYQTLSQIETRRTLQQGKLEAAALVADSQTGEIHALVGSRNGEIDGFNRAINAHRPVGSLIKPVIYLTALESGFDLISPIEDKPVTITPEFGDPWTPKNFNGKSAGTIPLLRGLAQSLNLASVNLGTTLGLPVIQQRFENLTGLQPDNRYPSFMLGAESMSPLQILELYSNFASGGFRTTPKTVIAVLNANHQPISQHRFKLEQTIASNHVATLNRALEIAMSNGTGRSSPYAKQGIAGKTGTSNNNRDSWFAGFDNASVFVVWTGHDDNTPTGLTGATGALTIWNAIAKSEGLSPLLPSRSSRLVDIEFLSGLRANADCADVVQIPLPAESRPQVKPGCGIKTRLSDRLRRWFSKQ